MSKGILLYAAALVCCFFSINTARSADNVNANHRKQAKKSWTIGVYAAADNNLRDFAARNIKQMANIGSNNQLNMLVHLDIRLIGNRKTTRRYYIDKNQVTHVNNADEHKPPMDSGDPQTLISFCKWMIEEYPADNYALVFWNHGTGIIDPVMGRLLHLDELYFYNPETNTYDLDRTVGYLDLIEMFNHDPKGICWDDTTGNYLTNQKLEFALNEVCTKYLKNKKFAIVGFDACLMSMLEIAEITKRYADIQVSSQEVEPGPGWSYDLVLSPFKNGAPTPQALAANIVKSYEIAYEKITRDYTLSAIDLSYMDELESNINDVATLLTSLIDQDAQATKAAIRTAKSNNNCTHFDEPSYKDMYHFYDNLIDQCNKAKGRANSNIRNSMNALIDKLQQGKIIMQHAIIANVSGPNLSKARGLSLYIPERRIHPSYKKTSFANTNKWANLLPLILVT